MTHKERELIFKVCGNEGQEAYEICHKIYQYIYCHLIYAWLIDKGYTGKKLINWHTNKFQKNTFNMINYIRDWYNERI